MSSKNNSNQKKLVSIGIPTYNRGEDLEICIKNILNQTYDNIEIIVSDNSSSDDKSKLLYKSNLFKNPKIRLIKNSENIGILKNTIQVLDNARGDLFCWISDDDWRSNTFIEEMVKDIEKLGEGYICFSNYLEVINDCYPSNKHLRNKNKFNFLKSNYSFFRKLYFYILDNANGKCNLFYSLIPTKELKKINFKKISNNWEELSMDRNIVQTLLGDNKVHINQNLLATLKVNNKKYYSIKKTNYSNNFFYKIIELVKKHNEESHLFFKQIKDYKFKKIIYILYFLFLVD